MPNISYNVKLIFSDPMDKNRIIEMLEAQKEAFNACSKAAFGLKKNDRNIVRLHEAFYKKFRKSNPHIPSQILIRAEQEVLSSYKSIKTNKHKIDKPCEKERLSIRLDKRIYSYKKDDSVENGFVFSVVSLGKRVKCRIQTYEKVEGLLANFPLCDPLIFIKEKDVFMGLSFKIGETVPQNEKTVGIDLGVRVFAATSEGNLYIDKKFNAEKRRLRYNKRKLRSAKDRGSKSAKRHLKKLRRAERNKNKNFVHHLTKKIVKDTDAGYLAIEDLKGIKSKEKKSEYKNLNRISQISFFDFRTILSYKALLHGKQVITVRPQYTSQIDSRTGKKDGTRCGRRYIGSDSVILDADINAACNIASRSKHPISYGGERNLPKILDGQGSVNSPIIPVGVEQATSL